MGKVVKYTKVKVIKITETQQNTLKKLYSYQVNVADFIITAIQEKIKRDYDFLQLPAYEKAKTLLDTEKQQILKA